MKHVISAGLTIAIHLIVLALLTVQWQQKTPPFKKPEINYVRAELVTLKSQTLEKQEKESPKIVDLTKQRQEQERQKKLEQAKRKKAADKKRQKELADKKAAEQKAENARKKAEQEKKLQEELTRKNEAKAFEEALAAEGQALEVAQTLEQEYEAIAMSYEAAIRQRIAMNWDRMPNARNGMECTLSIRLVPTGRVVSVAVVKSSGNLHFDDEAKKAVQRAEQFPELIGIEAEIFERYFRELTFVFRPEDLRR